MTKCVYWAAVILAVHAVSGDNCAAEPASLYDNGVPFTGTGEIDKHLLISLQERGVEPAPLCSDEVFVRRVYLDVIGTLPTPADVRAFLKDAHPGKRAALIDALLERDEFADYWSMKWCDLLRVKAEFPINLWPNAVQAYHRWIHQALRENMPYDKFARALLTSSGSCFRVPPVNFYRAVQSRDPASLAAAVALTFMGSRMTDWPEERRTGMAGFFARIAYKTTAEWKEEIVCVDPAASGPLHVLFPDGVSLEIPADKDPREIFAAWLIARDNPWFARNIVNRVWAWLFGRGIIHEPDDIREDNPPVHPALLAYLEEELLQSDYDLRHIYRIILNSHTYQQSPIPRGATAEAEVLFACYPVRRLEAEVLADVLRQITGGGESYFSAVPEPFTFIPEEQRSVLLADGSITSPFLEMFGRPARDTGLESERSSQPTDGQRLFLLNSSQIQKKIERSPRLRSLVQTHSGNRRGLVQAAYLGILSRYPAAGELDTVQEYSTNGDVKGTEVAADLVWALINTKEFLYRH